MRQGIEASGPRLKVYWFPLTQANQRGYGRVSVKLPHALQEAGVEIVGPHDWDWDYVIMPSTPFAGMLDRGGRVRNDLVFHTMFDADFLPWPWVHVLNRCGAVWVPSRWCYENFRDSGVTRPTFVAGYGVDSDEFPFADRSRLADGPMTFLAPSFSMFDRKGGYSVLKAWHRLELENARLVLKMNVGTFANVTLQGMDNVVSIKEDLDDGEWVALMHRAEVMLYPSAGEGFGLMPLEFACTGGLSVVTDYSGMQEYCHDVPMLTVRVGRIVPAALYNNIYQAEARWAEPDLDDLCDKMKWCHQNRGLVWEMGLAAAQAVREKWTWKRAGLEARAGLESLPWGWSGQKYAANGSATAAIAMPCWVTL